jgi:Second Messenger Oligonucleotide or Dinucleotide Synthetase domain
MNQVMNQDEAFEVFDEKLKLNPIERAAAIRLHNEITAVLLAAGVIVRAFLQGSFARKTMLGPLRDVDKVVILAGRLADRPDLRILPVLAMVEIEKVLAAACPEATFERGRHALKVDFGPERCSFDIVPAFETDTDDDDVLIANTEANTWDRSNTRTLIRVIAERNQACDGRFVHQVRMGKQYVVHSLEGLIPGLHVETFAYAAVTKPLEHPEACCRILEAGARLLTGTYTDPTGVDRICRKLKPEIAAQAQAAIAAAARSAREAQRLAAAGDHHSALAIWHELFGDAFPAPPAQPVAEAFQRSFAGGTVTSAGTVSTTSRGRQPSSPTRPWAPCVTAAPGPQPSQTPAPPIHGDAGARGPALVIGLAMVFADPAGVARDLREDAGLYGLISVEVRLADTDHVLFWLELEPWAPMAADGYPTERLSVLVWADGRIAAVPRGARARRWLHRYPDALGQLCLWYPDDPPELRWQWSDGLAAFITIAHRHLQAEEYWRRTGTWPAEDVPHGEGLHPIRTPALRAATFWRHR